MFSDRWWPTFMFIVCAYVVQLRLQYEFSVDPSAADIPSLQNSLLVLTNLPNGHLHTAEL